MTTMQAIIFGAMLAWTPSLHHLWQFRYGTFANSIGME